MRKKEKILYCFLSFVIAWMFAFSIYWIEGVYPGSDKTVLIYDELNQYSGIWENLKYILNNWSDFLFNWNSCLGGNNISLLAYYLGNPINCIIALFPVNELPKVVYYLTISKFAFASLSFSYFLVNSRKTKGIKVIIFSLCFSFMSYMVMYSMCLMWLDAVILLPIVIYGVEELVENRVTVIFIISLVLLFVTNFYIGFMIVIFSFLYLIWFNVKRNRTIRQFIICFREYVICGLVSACLASPVLLPTISGLSLGKGTESKSFSLSFTGNLYGIIRKALSCQYDTISADGTPSLFVGSLVFALAIIFLLDKKNSRKLRISTCGIFLIFLLSMWIKPINMIWHGFNNPVCYPFRYSFLFSFFVIRIASEEIDHIEEAITNLSEKRHYVLGKYFLPIFLVFTSIELWINASYILGWVRIETSEISSEEYAEKTDTIQSVLSLITNEEKVTFRVDGFDGIGNNDAMLFGYRGISSFTSTYNQEIFNFSKSVGIRQHDYCMFGYNLPPFIADILSLKYFYSKEENVISEMTGLYNYKDYTLFKNEYCLPIGFRIESDNCEFTGNIFENNNALAYSMASVENLYSINNLSIEKVNSDGTNEEYVITIKAKADGPVYVFFSGESREERKKRKLDNRETGVNRILAYVDKASIIVSQDNSFDTELLGIEAYYIGDLLSGEEKIITVTSNYPIGEGLSYSLDRDKHKQIAEKLRKNVCTSYSNTNSVFKGYVDNDEEELYFFSIPFQPGINVKVDGQIAKVKKVYNAFVGVNIPEGHHEIEIFYFPQGIYWGFVFFGVGICIMFLRKRNKIIKDKEVETNGED